MFFASIWYAFKKKVPAIKKFGKELAFYAGTFAIIAMIAFTIHHAWTPHGVHTLVEKEPITSKNCWFIFEKGGMQRRVMSYDPDSLPLGAQKEIKSSWINRGLNRMM